MMGLSIVDYSLIIKKGTVNRLNQIEVATGQYIRVHFLKTLFKKKKNQKKAELFCGSVTEPNSEKEESLSC